MRVALIVVIGAVALMPTFAQDREWDLRDLLEIGALDINDYWVGVFDENNLPYEQPAIVLFRARRVRSGCGIASSASGPFYCSNDHTIYLPRGFMQAYLDRVGDFAAVLILAHEWGHSVQAQVGELRGLSINVELQADCYAGSYARHADSFSENVVLDPGDLEEGATMLFTVGDKNVEWFDDNAHGSSEQRIDAYVLGLENGYSACEIEG